MAHETVKNRWVEQGVWNNKWNEMAHGLWKYEQPLELESESEKSSDAESPSPAFSFMYLSVHSVTRREHRWPKSDDEKRQIAERRVVREREREASRPYHQFVYQVSTERVRIEDEAKS